MCQGEPIARLAYNRDRRPLSSVAASFSPNAFWMRREMKALRQTHRRRCIGPQRDKFVAQLCHAVKVEP